MAERNNIYQPGIGSVGAYQLAGRPYITGSNDLGNGTQHVHNFPTVTRSITVINHSSNTIRVHFADKDTGNTTAANGGHFIELDSDEDSITMNVRADSIYISNASGAGPLEYKIYAELTGIATGSLNYNATSLVGLTE
tara:strand:- start:5878 stop:6291 length:414 start_codon:yes stop_codon:yes gene_type:complete